MGWLTLIKTLLSLADTVASYLRERNLMDAGAAEEVSRQIKETLNVVEDAKRLRSGLNDAERDRLRGKYKRSP